MSISISSLSPKDNVRTMEAFSTGMATVSRQSCDLMEKTIRNMAYKIQNNGLRCTLYEGVRLLCTYSRGIRLKCSARVVRLKYGLSQEC